jgi:DNA-binding CsgD family transcriptional regulator
MAERAVAGIGARRDFFSASAAVALAQAHLHAGDPVVCMRVLLDAGGGTNLPMVDPMTRCVWYELLAMAAAAQDRPEQAAEWADLAGKEADAWATPRRRGIAWLARVHALLPHDPPAALDAAREAVDAFAPHDRMGRGRAHLYAGTALALSGAPDPARAEFAQARTLLAECGAHLFVAQVDREERRMNARGPRRRAAANTTAPEQLLTSRELHVARLVTQGMTNRQIAQELFLSPKTVDVHLTRIYAKLGVPRRAALAELLTRAETTDHDG